MGVAQEWGKGDMASDNEVAAVGLLWGCCGTAVGQSSLPIFSGAFFRESSPSRIRFHKVSNECEGYH